MGGFVDVGVLALVALATMLALIAVFVPVVARGITASVFAQFYGLSSARVVSDPSAPRDEMMQAMTGPGGLGAVAQVVTMRQGLPARVAVVVARDFATAWNQGRLDATPPGAPDFSQRRRQELTDGLRHELGQVAARARTSVVVAIGVWVVPSLLLAALAAVIPARQNLAWILVLALPVVLVVPMAMCLHRLGRVRARPFPHGDEPALVATLTRRRNAISLITLALVVATFIAECVAVVQHRPFAVADCFFTCAMALLMGVTGLGAYNRVIRPLKAYLGEPVGVLDAM